MAVRGAGPSRRSHTKSRKGCKTCKRRHIRCDESFPQCRNCTKHHVRCDYMDGSESDAATASPEHSVGRLTPGAEDPINTWQQTTDLSYPDHNVPFQPACDQRSPSDLHLLHNITNITNSLAAKGVGDLTVWTSPMPDMLDLASAHSFVMSALLSFSACQLAYATQSPELRDTSIHHGAIALRGLHDAIGDFSKSNSDSALAASLVLVCQASDWRSWSSLDGGIRSVSSAMEGWKHESRWSLTINSANAQARSLQSRRTSVPFPEERFRILQSTYMALQQLRTRLRGRQVEVNWVDQLIDYVQRLQNSEPARNPEEQFNHLYVLRKWIFWAPIQILESQPADAITLTVIAHLYAIPLALEPLFPDVMTRLLAGWLLQPLERALLRAASFSPSGSYFGPSDIANLTQFPREALERYQQNNPWTQQRLQSAFLSDGLDFSIGTPLCLNTPGNLSPAFSPAQIYQSPQVFTNALRRSSSYLEIPTPQMSYDGHGFTYNTSNWGAAASPGFPPMDFTTAQAEQSLQYEENVLSGGDFQTGFVRPCEIWT